MTGQDRWARAALAAVADPGDREVSERLARIGAEGVWAELVEGRSPLRRAPAYSARAAHTDPSQMRDATLAARTALVVPDDPGWPASLDDLGAGAPWAIWTAGDPDLLSAPSVAIVGARACTRYGEQVAVEFGADLVQQGWTIVSGGAYGIDAAAHRGALAVGGGTVAVLACGADVAYPKGNAGLLARIVDDGLVVSELPPGRAPTRAGFLARNRLIAALGRVTVVVEAAMRSGSATTVARAVELGREVCGVPGPVTSAASSGVHALLRDGAVLVTEPAHVLELVGPWATDAGTPGVAPSGRDALDPAAQAVLDALPSRGAVDAETVAVAAGLPPDGVVRVLGRLLLDAWVERTDRGYRLAARAKGR
jgi:DNA processing protein